MKSIRTERLMLRDLDRDDAKAVHEYASNPEVVRYMEWGPNTEEETRAFIERSIDDQKEHPRRKFTLAIALKDESRLIGSCGIQVSSPDHREGWLGYCLNQHFWGKGYAPETAKALLDFGFSDLDLHRIFATCDVANIASAHVLEKSGMKREGCFREHKRIRGEWRDTYLYAILEHEWRTLLAHQSSQLV